MNIGNFICWLIGIALAILLGSSTASEVVERSFNEPPVYMCDSVSAVKLADRTYLFETSATVKNGASIVGYVYSFDDDWTVFSTRSSVEHTYAAPGTYTVTSTVYVQVAGETKTVAGSDCRVSITVTPATP